MTPGNYMSGFSNDKSNAQSENSNDKSNINYIFVDQVTFVREDRWTD